MRIMKPLAVLSLLTLLAACGSHNNGYYAADGTYVKPHEGAFSNDINERRSNYDQTVTAAQQNAAARYAFERRGYYDYYGNYIVLDSSLGVPPAMFPPAGMCRVWFPDRPLTTQPRVEACTNIQDRAPAGTYVIYGG